jgi:hypothetical protein
MAQVDHLIDAAAKEIVGGAAGQHQKTPRNQRTRASRWQKLYRKTG